MAKTDSAVLYNLGSMPPNGPRLSCSALVKNQIPPTCAVSFKRLLGSRGSVIRLVNAPMAFDPCNLVLEILQGRRDLSPDKMDLVPTVNHSPDIVV
jgi:hypothetical protein